ncbi:phosphoribosylamine--glycine ligase [Sinorhizobium sp. Sb3]|nr:phosphoribosylamine--glycine ligase [Sinorhizobium sp. Sb3]
MEMSIYAKTARFDTGRSLSEDEMRSIAPSIFATTAHESRSDRFKPIPTIEILRGLMKEGFMPVGARQSVSRTEGKANFTKHLIRLRRLDDRNVYNVGDTVCEILLKNANDGTSAYELLVGLFRVCCLNSLVAQTGTIDAIKVRHSGDVTGKVIEGTYSVLGEAERALAAPQDWSTFKMAWEEKEVLAEAARVLRFGEPDGSVKTLIKAEQLLVPRRQEDRADDLWTVWNVVQENSIKGGLRAVSRDEFGRPRRMKSRAINGIDQDIKLNKALWLIGEKMAAMKRG